MSSVPLSKSVQTEPPFTFEAAKAPHWYGVLTVVLFALVMPIGYLGNEGEALVAAVGGAAALSFVLQRRPPAVGVLILAALAAWAVASFAWSPLRPLQAHPHGYKQFEALTAPKLVAELVLYCAFVSGAQKLVAGQRDAALRWLGWTLAGVSLLLAADAVAAGQIYGTFNRLFGRHDLTRDLAERDAARGCYTVMLLLWPVGLATWGRIPAAVPAVIAALAAVSAVRLGVDAPAAALIASGVVFLGVRATGRLGAWACIAGSTVYFLAAPFVFLRRGGAAGPDLPSDVGKMSWHVRIDIWRFASQLIAKRPLQGYGLDASRAYEPAIPMHPHDAAIQLWLELGVLGPALAALFFGWLFYKIGRIARHDPAWAAVACATASVYLLIGAVSFGVWQEWWLALGAVAAAACGMVLRARRDVAEAEPADEGLTAL